MALLDGVHVEMWLPKTWTLMVAEDVEVDDAEDAVEMWVPKM